MGEPRRAVQNATDAASCIDCEAGQFSSLQGMTSCSQCLAGTYSISGSSTCSMCGVGLYSSTTAAEFCQRCGPGEYATGQTTTACTLCSKGKYSNTTSNVRVECSSTLNNSLCLINLQCLDADCSRGIIGRYIPGEMYENLEEMTVIISSPKPCIVQVDFTIFATEQDYDVLDLYSCTDWSCSNETHLTQLSGVTLPPTVNSSTGILKLVWSSEVCCPKPSSLCFCDDPAKAKILVGWEAIFTVHGATECTDCPLGTYSLNTGSSFCQICANTSICGTAQNMVTTSREHEVAKLKTVLAFEKKSPLKRDSGHRRTFAITKEQRIPSDFALSEPLTFQDVNMYQLPPNIRKTRQMHTNQRAVIRKRQRLQGRHSNSNRFSQCSYSESFAVNQRSSCLLLSNLFLFNSVNTFASDDNAQARIDLTMRTLRRHMLVPTLSIFEMCGDGNDAAYGRCIASTFSQLDIVGLPAVNSISFPGFPLDISVEKKDAYGQLIITDSLSVIQIYAKYSSHAIKGTPAISGNSLGRMESGVANFSLAIKPGFLNSAVRGLSILDVRSLIYANGLDSESVSNTNTVQMQSPLEEILFSNSSTVCPPGYILVLDASSINAPQPGKCSYCNSGTYSVSPLYSATSSGDPSCLNCPIGGNCSKGGSYVSFELGTWIVSSGIYKLISCPAGYELLNSIGGVFSQDAQQCILCPASYYCLGTTSPIPCPLGSFSPAGSNASSECTASVMVVVSVTLSESKSDFRSDSQARFVKALASVAGSAPGRSLRTL